MSGIHITDIEAAINWWRQRNPSDGLCACAEVRALAEVYALMVYYREPHCDDASMPVQAMAAWLGWYASTPDAPCIAICSTSQGDGICKGCGRSFDEVQNWTVMTPGEKRVTWRRPPGPGLQLCQTCRRAGPASGERNHGSPAAGAGAGCQRKAHRTAGLARVRGAGLGAGLCHHRHLVGGKGLGQ